MVLRTKPRRCGSQVYRSSAPSSRAIIRAIAFSKPSPARLEKGMLFGSAQTRRTSASKSAISVAFRGRLLADLLSVAPGVHAERVSEDALLVGLGVLDVVGEGAACGVETGLVADALGDLVIGAGSVAARAQAADLGVALVERNAAAEGNGAAADLALLLAVILRLDQAFGIERVSVRGTPQRMAGQAHGVQPRGRHRHRVGA